MVVRAQVCGAWSCVHGAPGECGSACLQGVEIVDKQVSKSGLFWAIPVTETDADHLKSLFPIAQVVPSILN